MSQIQTKYIANNAVTSSKFRQSSGLSVVGVTGTSSANVADITGTANQVLRVNGAGTGLSFGTIDLTSSAAVVGALTVTNGGTGVASFSINQVLLGGSTSTGTLQQVSGGSAGQVLTATGTTTAPTFQTLPAAATFSFAASNLGLSTSVSGNALTIALKQSDGSTDPSTGTSAVVVGMRSSTLTSGAYTTRSVTSALSLTLSSGTSLAMLINQSAFVWVYIIDSDGAGTMKLAASTVRYDDTSRKTTIPESSTVTITNASPGVFTGTANGLSNNTPIILTTTGTLPTGLSPNTIYYIVSQATNSFSVSASPGGTAINTSSAGSGTHTFHHAGWNLVSDAAYANCPIRLIGRLNVTPTTLGQWVAPTQISLLPGEEQPEAGNIVAKWQNTANTSVANTGMTIIPFNTMILDTVGALATDGQNFIIPQTGSYQIGSGVAYSSSLYVGGERIFVEIDLNGSSDTRIDSVAIQAGVTQSFAAQGGGSVIKCFQYDLVTLQTANSRTAGATTLNGATNSNYASILRTGN